MLDLYFKLTNKSYLIHRFWYDWIRFCNHLVVAYFLGHPVYRQFGSRDECKDRRIFVIFIHKKINVSRSNQISSLQGPRIQWAYLKSVRKRKTQKRCVCMTLPGHRIAMVLKIRADNWTELFKNTLHDRSSSSVSQCCPFSYVQWVSKSVNGEDHMLCSLYTINLSMYSIRLTRTVTECKMKHDVQ